MYRNLKTRSVTALLGMVFVIAAAMGPLSIEAAALHAIIVADTTDSSIGNSTAMDMQNIQLEMQRIRQYTGLDLKETLIRGNQALPEKVFEQINHLQIDEDDVVIFYFSGHGYRTPGKGDSPWPNLYFSRVEKGIDFDLIGQKLETYNPRFLMVIADACNNIISDEYAPPLVRKMIFMRTPEQSLEENYRKLFLDFKGVVMMTSSKAGEYSWGTNRGGLFTLALLQNLANEVKFSSDPSWYTILDKAAVQVQKNQHPDFRIYLDGVD
jgi:hypothetical protein